MKYIDLPKPHGFLIWRGKQKAIASTTPYTTGEKLLLISSNEAYGEVVLGNPVEMLTAEFEKYEEHHRIRPEDRRLYWPDVDKFYVQWIKEYQPYEEYIEEKHVDSNGKACEFKRVLSKIPVLIDGLEARFLDLPEPTTEQKQLLEKAERLPKTIYLSDAVSLEGNKAIIQNVNPDAVRPILNATFDNADLGDASLDLYQLALVRVPRFLLKKKELTMPYKVQFNHPDCKDDKPVGIVNTESGELKGCSEDVATAKEAVSALMANEEDKGKTSNTPPKRKPSKSESRKMLEEARKCYDEGMAMPMMYGGPVTFAELDTIEETQEIADDMNELSYQFQMLSNNVFSNPDIKDKGSALTSLATEYSNRVQQVGKKELEESSKWVDDDTSREEAKVGKRVRNSMKEKLNQLWSTFKEFMDWANEADKDELPGFEKGFGIKQVNGIPWFIAYSTNAFEDREAEIFSTKSLEKYVQEADAKQDRGHFNFWHIPNTDFAKKEWQGVVGRFLVEAGPFLDNELGQKAHSFFEQFPDGHDDIAPEGWGCSPEYRYLPEERKSGVYQNIWITRTSVLPRLAAANIWTKGAIEMALSEQQKAAAVKIFGEDLTAKIVGQAEAATKDLEEAGIAHKGESEVSAEIEVPVDAIAEAVIKQLNLDFQPFSDALALVGQELATLKAEMKSLEKQKQLEQKVETPRYIFSLQQASKAAETILKADDPLLQKKPIEAAPTAETQDNSGAANFFPVRR